MKRSEEYIQHHSEPVQEIMGTIPSWITRWGVTLVLSILMLLLFGCYLIRYPETVSGTINMTSSNPPSSLVARQSGLLDTLLVRNGSMVREGDLLAVLSSPANIKDIVTVRKLIDSKSPLSLEYVSDIYMFNRNLQLGTIQQQWSDLRSVVREFRDYVEMDHAKKRIAFLRLQKTESEKQYVHMKLQQSILEEEVRLQAISLHRDSLLYVSEALTQAEYEASSQEYLSKLVNLESFRYTMKEAHMNMTSLEREVCELEMADNEHREMLTRRFDQAMDAIRSAYASWTENYAFIAPADGIVSLSEYWSDGQFISAGETLASVIPSGENEYKGKLRLSSTGMGKVDLGQTVNVRFNGFPHTEFGVVRGIVSDISQVPERLDDGSIVYMLVVSFPEGLVTTYGRTLPFMQDMDGIADVVTYDKRLIGTILSPIKSLARNR